MTPEQIAASCLCIDGLCPGCQRVIDALAAETARADALAGEVARLREALEFYADRRQYNGVAGHPDQTPPIVFECGARARNTLAAAAGALEVSGE